MAPPTAAARTGSTGRPSLRDRIAMIAHSEPLAWALLLAFLSAVAAVSGAYSD